MKLIVASGHSGLDIKAIITTPANTPPRRAAAISLVMSFNPIKGGLNGGFNGVGAVILDVEPMSAGFLQCELTTPSANNPVTVLDDS